MWVAIDGIGNAARTALPPWILEDPPNSGIASTPMSATHVDARLRESATSDTATSAAQSRKTSRAASRGTDAMELW